MREKGYTLLELLVVMVIIGILATQVVFMLSSATSQVKGAAFNMRNDFNLARSEAVNRNQDVLVDFIEIGDVDDDGAVASSDGYRICVDVDADNNCDSADTMIKNVSFGNEVQFYDTDLSAVGGPNKETDNATPLVPDDGVSFTANRFIMRSDGTSNIGGTVYLFVAEPLLANKDAATGMRAPPYAVVVAPTTGRVRLARWDNTAGAWGTK